MTDRLKNKAALVLGAGSVGEGVGNGRAIAALCEIDDHRESISALILEKGTPGRSVLRTEGTAATATARTTASSG